jgi:hypothetical protein
MTTLHQILNVRGALRKLLTDPTAFSKNDITPELQPTLRPKLAAIAQEAVANPDLILREHYTGPERARDWASLLAKVVLKDGEIMPIDTRSRPGHKILDHFMPHFYDVKNHKGVSVRGLMTQERLEKALLTNITMHSTPYQSEIRRMLIMTGGLGNVTKYRTVTSKAIVQYFGARRVLDPCCGWGGRMLGSLAAAPDTYYVGCEPDPNTATGLHGILVDLGLLQRAEIFQKTAEYLLPILATGAKFDMVLTSPPYFNLELYVGGDQSIEHHKTWDEWVENWLRPVILASLACLKAGGVSCWSVKNFKSDSVYPLADVTKKIHKDAGWELVKTVVMRGSARPGGGRIEGGKEMRGSEEETFCFKMVV